LSGGSPKVVRRLSEWIDYRSDYVAYQSLPSGSSEAFEPAIRRWRSMHRLRCLNDSVLILNFNDGIRELPNEGTK
jgi:hypothetical protein